MSLIRRIANVLEAVDTLEVDPRLMTAPECCTDEQLNTAVAFQLARQCEDWGLRLEYLLAFDQNNALVYAAYMPSPSRYFDLKGIRSLPQVIEELGIKSNLRIERHNRSDVLREHVESMDPKCLERASAALLATVAALETALQRMPSEASADLD